MHLGCGEQSQRRLQCVIIPPEGRLASKRTNGNGSGFTRCIAKTVGFLWTTKILPPSVCLTVNAAFLKTNLCQNDRKGIFHLKIATWKKKHEHLSEVGDFKRLDSPLKVERRNNRNTETCWATHNKVRETWPARLQRRFASLNWVQLLFQSRRESLPTGSDDFKAKASLLWSYVHTTEWYREWEQISYAQSHSFSNMLTFCCFIISLPRFSFLHYVIQMVCFSWQSAICVFAYSE